MKNNIEIIEGLVFCGSRNILTVKIENNIEISNNNVIANNNNILNEDNFTYLECRIKGKVLKDSEKFYNPIAPGDVVIIERTNKSASALIVSVKKRRNLFTRHNSKGAASSDKYDKTDKYGVQILASNVDLVLPVCTPSSPPFRPRFLDRVLLQAEAAGIEAVVICNKIDLNTDLSGEENEVDIKERLDDLKRIGYKVVMLSAKIGEGIEELQKIINGKTSVLIGQSGVGKSSIINALKPGLDVREGCLNEKYDRGKHTTTMSIMIDLGNDTKIIDTPGIRQFIPDGIQKEEIILYMREFPPLAGKCSFGNSCLHKTEPGCKIIEAVNDGSIHKERYESFLRIYDHIDSDS